MVELTYEIVVSMLRDNDWSDEDIQNCDEETWITVCKTIQDALDRAHAKSEPLFQRAKLKAAYIQATYFKGVQTLYDQSDDGNLELGDVAQLFSTCKQAKDATLKELADSIR